MSPIATDEQCDEVANALSVMQEEARPAWIMARVAALLSQYYAADVPPSVVSIMAEDWKEELAPYPQWAITNAVRWWKSEANAERKRRPLEGDISARAKHEMLLVRHADRAVRRYWDWDRNADQRARERAEAEAEMPAPPMTAAEREESRKRVAEYVKGAGFAAKRAVPVSPAYPAATRDTPKEQAQ